MDRGVTADRGLGSQPLTNAEASAAAAAAAAAAGPPIAAAGLGAPSAMGGDNQRAVGSAHEPRQRMPEYGMSLEQVSVRVRVRVRVR